MKRLPRVRTTARRTTRITARMTTRFRRWSLVSIGATAVVLGFFGVHSASAWSAPISASSRCSDDRQSWQATVTITNGDNTVDLVLNSVNSNGVALAGLATGDVIKAGGSRSGTATGLSLSTQSLAVTVQAQWANIDIANTGITVARPAQDCAPTAAVGPPPLPPTLLPPPPTATTVLASSPPETTTPATVTPTTPTPTTPTPTTVLAQQSPPRAPAAKPPSQLPATGQPTKHLVDFALVFTLAGVVLLTWAWANKPGNQQVDRQVE